jgi:Pyruvate/2-oxoacid:ferredoxin oxidoreductase delta subunit
VGGEIVGLEHDKNPVLVEGEKRGLGPHRIEDIEIVGIEAQSLRVPDFKTPATYFGGHGLGHLTGIQRMLRPLFRDGMSVKPRVIKDRCIACGTCVSACPVKAITINKKKYARIDDDQCIRCYCCHEMCEEKAIELKRSLLYRMVRPA